MQTNYGEFVKGKTDNLNKILKQAQDNIIIAVKNNMKDEISQRAQKHSIFEKILAIHASIFIVIIVSFICWFISLILLISNTSKMSNDNNAKKYYNLNTAATVLVTLAIILLVIFYYNANNYDVQTYYYEIFSSIYSMLIIGCIILYINTNNMAKDKDAKEYYISNIFASVSIVIPFLVSLGFFIYMNSY